MSIMLTGHLWAQDAALVKSVYFGGGSYYLDPIQAEEVRIFLAAIPHIEYHQVLVSSHTDNIGGATYNQRLSELRSTTVVDLLHRLAVPPDNILIQNNGQQNPYFDNSTLDGRLANRRVDIVLLPLVN
ncbi:MAG: hypothetical protein OHK0039_12690 [Bacteroidia bacterium]